MTNDHERFGADLSRLYQMGSRNLPIVAEAYRSAAQHLAETDPGLATAFARPPEFGGPNGYTQGALTAVRDLAHDFFVRTSINLDATAKALLTAVQIYAEADGVARDELDRLNQQNGLV